MCASISASGTRFSAPIANTDRIWRAGAETVLSATLVVFLFAYLNLNRWHVRAWHVAALWLLILADLVGLAVFDAPVAAGVARISLATIAVVGFVLDSLSRLAWFRPRHHADSDLVPARCSGFARPVSRSPAG